MKFTALVISTVVSLSTVSETSAFVPQPTFTQKKSIVPSGLNSSSIKTRSHFKTIQVNRRSKGMSMNYSVGIVGATGAVGKELINCLEKSPFPTSSLRIFGSERSAGKEVSTKFGPVTVELFDVAKARECDVIFLAVSGDFALEHAPAISAPGGAVVIDNSSAFRMKENIPLVVPEINGQKTKGARLIANPNCTTAIGLMALWPLHKLFKLKRVIMSTYQAASGAGQPGMDELWEGTKSVVNGECEVAKNSVFAHPLPFNLIPHIDKFQDNGYTKEEMKVTWETRKICDLPGDFPVSCTAVRIPTSRAHSEAIVVETELPVDVEAARKALSEAPGVKLVDEPSSLKYPMPLTATGQYDVEVGRLRKSLVFGDYGLEFFVSGDQLLRGAALNAVLVAEEMAKNGALEEAKSILVYFCPR
jgi:aspartate-semialdehyde dehydrogenase